MAFPVQADVTDAGQVGEMVDEIERRWGPVEILVNNATGPQPMLPFEEYSWRDFQDQLDFFVKAPVLLAQRTIGTMKAARRGRIINIGSEVVDLGNANFSAYVTAKAAMVGMTRSLAREFGPWAITVNLIAPGWIPVERHREFDPAAMSAYAERVPLLRHGVPGDIAGAVVFLASDEAGFITGSTLSINGGQYLT
jgi:3-oxoacyl-[acyl-carrier protein] reductase